MKISISRKRFLAWILTAMMILSSATFAYGAGGTISGAGTAEDPGVIQDAADFAAMATDGVYVLDADITITASYPGTFTGKFDGQGHTVTLNGTSNGVFATLGDGAEVSRLVVAGSISGPGIIGGIAGIATNAVVKQCVNKASIATTGKINRAAGIIANATGADNTTQIIECVNLGDISGAGSSCYSCGIVAYVAGTVSVISSYNMGNITGNSRAAGIVGQIGSTNKIENCYSAGTYAGNASHAGILGWNNAGSETNGAENCYFLAPEGSDYVIQGGGSGTTANCAGLATKDELVAKMLELGYVADTADINNGYPILSWQAAGAAPEEPEEPDPADQAVADALKAKFDDELGALKPNYAADDNIVEMVKGKVEAYTGIENYDPANLSVTLVSSDEAEIAEDGTINYVKANEWTFSGLYSKNVTCVFKFTYGTASVETKERTAIVGWDRTYFEGKMAEDAAALTADALKGENESLDAVEKPLVIPQCMGTNAKQVWSKIEWTSSNPAIFDFEAEQYSGMNTPLKGVVKEQPELDTEVTLTATLIANENILNTNVERAADFTPITKTFTIIVKGTGIHIPTEEELNEILTKYYTRDLLKDFVTKETLNLDCVTGDISLPRYTTIKDEEGNLVFENKEITVTSSDESVLKINGYRGIVDIFQNEDKTVTLTVTFTRKEVTSSIQIPLTVKAVTEAELDAELALMEEAKAFYEAALLDGQYADAAHVDGNLHSFYEIAKNADGQVYAIYKQLEATGTGIVADGYFEDSWEMEAAGYNRFQSSDPAIVAHENLVVTRDELAKEVTVKSWLSSAKFKELAKNHPEHEKLQKLYKQEVSATFTIVGTKPVVVKLDVTAPTKAEYLEGEEFDATGLVVNATYNDDSVVDVTADATVTGFTGEAGKNTVTVAFDGVSETFEVIVHVAKTVGKTSATYVSTGYTGDQVCQVCNTILKKGSTIAKKKLAKPTITLKAYKKKVTVSIKKVTGATKYQVKYKQGKTWKTKYSTSTKVTLYKLTSKKTVKVYVKAMAVKGSKKAYSVASTTKSIKVK